MESRALRQPECTAAAAPVSSACSKTGTQSAARTPTVAPGSRASTASAPSGCGAVAAKISRSAPWGVAAITRSPST